MSTPTEQYELQKQLDRVAIAAFLEQHGHPEPYWTTDEATQEFEFLGFCYGVASVRRRSDGVKGSLVWADGDAVLGSGHYGRLYFGFHEEG